MKAYYSYDVFLSHSSKDKDVVRQLANRLKNDGLRVWFDEWEIEPGDMIGLRIEEGLTQSRNLVLFISSDAITSDWVTLERHTILFRDPTNSERRFIPIRLDDSEAVGTLRQFAYIDWRRESVSEYKRLLSVCRPAVELAPSEETLKSLSPIKSYHLKTDVWQVGISADASFASIASSQDMRVIALKGMAEEPVFKSNEGTDATAISSDGQYVLKGSDENVDLFVMKTQTHIARLKGQKKTVIRIIVTPDSRWIAASSANGTICVWDRLSFETVAILAGATSSPVTGLAISDDGKRIAFGSLDQKLLYVWQVGRSRADIIEGHKEGIFAVAMTADGKRAVTASKDRTLRMWDLEALSCVATFEGHTDHVYSVALSPSGHLAVSGSYDCSIRVWDLKAGKCIAVLRGHHKAVTGIALSPDSKTLLSGSQDGTIRIWDLSPFKQEFIRAIGSKGIGALRYTNAKVLMVGDTGVGKSGLAIRLTSGCFERTISTDAAWVTQLKLHHANNASDIEREIWLWDFGGQSDYRLMQQLFMDETALAVFVFNPQNDNPFDGLGQWDRDITRAARSSFKKILVAGRCDRGGPTVSRDSIDLFVKERGFNVFLETSALMGSGCDKLYEAIIENISWDNIPWTSSTTIFKLLKESIIKLRDEGKVLLRVVELWQHIELMLPEESYSIDELRSVIGLLVGPGAIWKLEFGDFILLQPEIMNSYASALIRKVRSHTDEIGCITEAQVLAGDLDYQDMKRVSEEDEKIILLALHQKLVNYGLCFREHSDDGTLLIFPSYFRRERPSLEKHPSIFVTYCFSGSIDEIYATLVVRLCHTRAFEKDSLWRYAADFRTQEGKRLGFKVNRQTEGNAEMTVYFAADISDETKTTFIRYIHDHLKEKDPNVIRRRHYVCSHCNTSVSNDIAIENRLSRGLKDIACINCDKRIPLFHLIERKFRSGQLRTETRKMEQDALVSIDNESRELILVGHAFSVAGEAGQIFRPVTNSDWGIDGEIEFKNDRGEASGKRVYLQLKSGDSYLYKRKNGQEIFSIKNSRLAEYWQAHEYPVMLVVRNSDGNIRWMNISHYLKIMGGNTRSIIFEGEPFTAMNVQKVRNRLFRINENDTD